MNQLFDQIQQKLHEIEEITHAGDQLERVMSNSNSTAEDFDAAIQNGIHILEQIEEKSKA